MKHILSGLVLAVLSIHISIAQSPNELVGQLKNSKEDTAKVMLYLQLVKTYQYATPDSAMFYANQGLDLARKIGHHFGEGLALRELCSLHEIHGNFGEAAAYAEKAMEVFRGIDYHAGVAGMNNALGIIEARKGNFSAATNYFLKALHINEEIRNVQGIVQGYIKLGLINSQTGELDKALDFYNKALKLNEDTLSSAYPNLLSNIGIIYAQKGDMKKALSYFELGILSTDSARHTALYANLLMNAGNALEKSGKLKEALVYHTRGLYITQRYGMPDEESRILFNMATLVEQQGNLNLALSYLKSSLVISQKLGNNDLNVDIYKSMANIFEKEKKYPEALSALKQHYLYRDSVFSEDKKHEIAALQSTYELNKSKAEIQNLELINRGQVLQRNIFIMSIAGILVILFILAFYLTRTRRLNKELKQSNSVKDKLFSIIAHDLRSPMSNTVQLLHEDNVGDFSEEERTDILSTIKRHSETTLETLDTLLHWGQAQLRGINVNQTDFAVSGLIRQSIDMYKIQAIHKSITLIDHCDENIRLYADADHIEFVFRNLISNAIKFTYPGGKIEINARAEEGKEMITFSVSDNGKGISEENRKKIFQSYLHTSWGTSNEKGTGIGLMLCKEFVEANGGQIWFTSEEEKGSTFYFSCKRSKA